MNILRGCGVINPDKIDVIHQNCHPIFSQKLQELLADRLEKEYKEELA